MLLAYYHFLLPFLSLCFGLLFYFLQTQCVLALANGRHSAPVRRPKLVSAGPAWATRYSFYKPYDSALHKTLKNKRAEDKNRKRGDQRPARPQPPMTRARRTTPICLAAHAHCRCSPSPLSTKRSLTIAAFCLASVLHPW